MSQILNFVRDSADNTAKTADSKLIVVEGVIGVGKTSMARLLGDRWKSPVIYESFEDNPFLIEGFYKNTEAFAFNTEVFFLLQRFKQQRGVLGQPDLLVSDYLFQKNWIFAQLNLSKNDLEVYRAVYEQFLPKIRKPDLVVYLQADLETLLRRIYFRDRSFERSLNPSYLENLMNEYSRFFSTYTEAPVVQIPTSGLDFVNDAQDFRRCCSLIEERLRGYFQLPLLANEHRSREAQANV